MLKNLTHIYFTILKTLVFTLAMTSCGEESSNQHENGSSSDMLENAHNLNHNEQNTQPSDDSTANTESSSETSGNNALSDENSDETTNQDISAISAGHEVYTNSCQSCHDETGRHVDFASIVPTKTNEELLNLITSGQGYMPPVAADWGNEQKQNLIAYLRNVFN